MRLWPDWTVVEWMLVLVGIVWVYLFARQLDRIWTQLSRLESEQCCTNDILKRIDEHLMSIEIWSKATANSTRR